MNYALLFPLLVAYQIKHWTADFPLQGEYMLRKFAKDPKIWVPSLAAHAGVHALFTLLIGLVAVGYHPAVLALAVFDFAIHFTMDRIKASPSMLGRYKSLDANGYMNVKSILAQGDATMKVLGYPENYGLYIQAKERLRHSNYFWWILGFDQMVHHLTHYLIIACLLSL
jgi:hypothetical protein